MSTDSNKKGFVTLPAESGQEKTVIELIRKWGADTIRDSDGTELSPELINLGMDIYSTVCLVRAEQKWPRQHPEQLPQKFLMSEKVTAKSDVIEIDPMAGYYREKYTIDTVHDPKEWWEVIDRTTGEVVDVANWDLNAETGIVTIRNCARYHVYTVNFLVYQIWDTTSMYNHLSNNWTCEHVMSVDPYYKETYDHLMKWFDNWIDTHPNTSVVRLTTLAYHFTVDSDQDSVDKYRDWVGYMDTISIPALKDFEKQFGYRLRSEDFVDEGFYNATYRVPNPRYLDWMKFIHRFVVEFGKVLVDKVHKAGKKAAVFWGDHWVGMEPYSPEFQEMKIDMNIGACEDGVALRRLADSPGPQAKEIRLYPYFFPDVFCPGGKPTDESVSNWAKIRRAMMRQPVDRIGWGGYLSLASQFPDFVEHIEQLSDEFRTFKTNSNKTPSYKAPIKVAVLNCWGKLRSWINSVGRDQKFFIKRPDVTAIAGTNLLECLSGLPVEVEFISFADVEKNGIPSDVNVIINDGEDGTAWSGGRWWANEKVVSAVREFIDNGGGFIGARGPSAFQQGGRMFQLSDVFGVDREVGNSLEIASIKKQPVENHFILDDNISQFDFGGDKSYVYCCDPETDILRLAGGLHIMLSTKQYGSGRSVFFAGLPYSHENSRMLERAIFWAAGKEDSLRQWHTTNIHTDCAAWPQSGKWVVVNNDAAAQETTVYDGQGNAHQVSLEPYGAKWFDI